MIPDTVFGLLVVAASLGPGYLFVRIGELRRPRPSRSTLLELAELVATGGTSTIAVLLVVLPIARWTDWVDLDALAKEGTDYALTHPFRAFTLLLTVLSGSYLVAWRASLIVHRRDPAYIKQHSVWHEAFRRQEDGRRAFATVELRDGRELAGPIAYYTTREAPPDERELALEAPVRARPDMRSPYEDVPIDRVVVRASDIVALSVRYY